MKKVSMTQNERWLAKKRAAKAKWRDRIKRKSMAEITKLKL